MPDVGQLFDSVEFTELEAEEAKKLVEQYNKDAKAILPPPVKRSRFSDRDRNVSGKEVQKKYM